jgi:hypothetical protein
MTDDDLLGISSLEVYWISPTLLKWLLATVLSPTTPVWVLEQNATVEMLGL